MRCPSRAASLARTAEFLEADQSDFTCPAALAKRFPFPAYPNHFYIARHPVPHRGAFRDRHGRRVRDAVDAAALLTNGAEADGEVVWS